MPLFDLSKRLPAQQPTLTPVPDAQRKRLRYEEMITFIERLVVERNLAPGDLLPTQAELAEAAGVSLITVRRALEELERAGRVRRHQGIGTYLARPRNEPSPRVGTRLLSLVQGVPSAALRGALRLEDGAQVWEINRQRLVDGEPKILETAVIPVALAPSLDRFAGELTGSLYELLLRQYGLEDQAEEQYLEVTAADDDERRLLRLPSKSQVVRLRGLSNDQRGVPFDCFTQVYPALEFGFYISGGTSRGLFGQPAQEGWDVTTNERGPV
jgi:DNA-binding GntR family transcriptional regulator